MADSAKETRPGIVINPFFGKVDQSWIVTLFIEGQDEPVYEAPSKAGNTYQAVDVAFFQFLMEGDLGKVQDLGQRLVLMEARNARLDDPSTPGFYRTWRFVETLDHTSKNRRGIFTYDKSDLRPETRQKLLEMLEPAEETA